MRSLTAVSSVTVAGLAIAACAPAPVHPGSTPPASGLVAAAEPRPTGVFLVRDLASHAFSAYTWDGIAGTSPTTLGTAAGAMALRPAPSPDGRWFVVTKRGAQGLQRSIIAADGRTVAALDPGDQYSWGDDSRHMCVLTNPNGVRGPVTTLQVIDDQTGVTTSLGPLPRHGPPSAMPSIIACAASRSQIVLRFDDTAMGTGQLRNVTVSLVVLSMTDGRTLDVVSTNALGDGVHATVAPDGSWYATVPASNSGPSQIRALPSGSLLRTVQDGAVLTCSNNGRLVLVSKPGTSASDEVIEAIRLNDGAVVWSERGHLTSIALAPFSSEMAVGIGIATPGPGPEPTQDVYLVDLRGGHLLVRNAAAV